MTNNQIIIITLSVIVVLAILLNMNSMMNMMNNIMKNYTIVKTGTCKSNGLKDISEKACKSYFGDGNGYNVTRSMHGPPGCWEVKGQALNKILRENPQYRGKGFACWANENVNDGKQCSDEFPCVCTK